MNKLLELLKAHTKASFKFFSLQQKYKIFRPFLTVGLFFTLLLALEALTSLKALFFVLTGIYAYNWIVVYSLYDEYKTESKINIRISTIEPIEPISNA